MQKFLYLHIGGTKTGSTAIQNFLYFNVNQLEASGFSYNNSPNISHDREIQCGNGEQLWHELVQESKTKTIDNLLLSYLGTNLNGICSCELFSTLEKKHWKTLIDSAKRLDIQLKIIFYVRNVIPFFISGFNQGVKRHGITQSIEAWVENQPWQHLETLKILYKFKHDITYDVLSYDYNSKFLIKSFFGAIGIEQKIDISNNEEEKMLNRSLTNAERTTIQDINKKFGSVYSQDLSDFFIYNRPEAEFSIELESIIEIAHKRFAKEVSWINKFFFNNAPIVSIHSQSNRYEKKYKEVDDDNLITLGLLTEWVTTKLTNIQNENMDIIISSLAYGMRAIDWENASHLDIPSEFDPVAYLLLNIDILLSGVHPYQHYIISGQYEERKIAWPKFS